MELHFGTLLEGVEAARVILLPHHFVIGDKTSRHFLCLATRDSIDPLRSVGSSFWIDLGSFEKHASLWQGSSWANPDDYRMLFRLMHSWTGQAGHPHPALRAACAAASRSHELWAVGSLETCRLADGRQVPRRLITQPDEVDEALAAIEACVLTGLPVELGDDAPPEETQARMVMSIDFEFNLRRAARMELTQIAVGPHLFVFDTH